MQREKNIQPIVRLPQHEWILSNNLPPSSPPLFCSRMNEETTLHATDRVMINRVIINVVVEHEQKAPARELIQCYEHTCPIPHCRHLRELIQCQTDWGEDWRELCWHWETVCVCVCVCIWVVCVKVNWLSARAPNKSCWEKLSSKHDSYCRLTSRAYLLRVILSLWVGSRKNGTLGVQFTYQSSLHQQYQEFITELLTIHMHITGKWLLLLKHDATSMPCECQVQQPYTWYNTWSVGTTYTLATLMVCCSMASWMLALSCSRTLLNSSIDKKLLVSKCFTSWWMGLYQNVLLNEERCPSTYAAEASICQHQSSCLQLPLTTVLRREVLQSFYLPHNIWQ